MHGRMRLPRLVRSGLRACLAAAALSLALASGAEAKKPVTVSCGETISADTRLANDLTDCPNNGIVIGADDITLDLNGHTIDGDGFNNLVEDCPDGYCDSGIDITGHHQGITIENGTVQEFSSGIWIEGGAGHRLRGLSAARNGDGIDVYLATDTVVTKNSVTENVFGIWVGRSESIRIERNSVAEFAEDRGCGIEVARSERVLVAGNEVLATSDPEPAVAGETCGICVCFGSSHNRIERNSVSGNGFVGVLVDHSDDNSVTENHIFRNGIGVILIGDRNSISRNRVVDTAAACEDCGGDIGISFEGGQGNLIANNTVERTREGPGIQFAAFEPETPPAVDNIARSNVVRNGGFDGILVEPTAADTLLDRNTASQNADDGIDVESPSTTLARNTANQNQDLGIEAVPGVTDGGRNKASGNGSPLQCTNVFCG
jgi:large repetitive protein